ncbi:hypothetical protein Dimus_006422 [Dionaea muscipula]
MDYSQLISWISTPLALAATIIALFFAVKFLANKRQKKSKDDNGDQKKKKYAPIAGTMLNLLLHFNRLHDYMTHLAARYTTYRILAPTWNEIYTSDPANVEYILKTNFDNYGKDPKICFSDDILPDGHYVKKGDMVAYQAYAMGRMKFIWGADAEIFRPERWLNEDGIFQPESPFKFTAFQVHKPHHE